MIPCSVAGFYSKGRCANRQGRGKGKKEKEGKEKYLEPDVLGYQQERSVITSFAKTLPNLNTYKYIHTHTHTAGVHVHLIYFTHSHTCCSSLSLSVRSMKVKSSLCADSWARRRFSSSRSAIIYHTVEQFNPMTCRQVFPVAGFSVCIPQPIMFLEKKNILLDDPASQSVTFNTTIGRISKKI